MCSVLCAAVFSVCSVFWALCFLCGLCSVFCALYFLFAQFVLCVLCALCSVLCFLCMCSVNSVPGDVRLCNGPFYGPLLTSDPDTHNRDETEVRRQRRQGGGGLILRTLLWSTHAHIQECSALLAVVRCICVCVP